ncbi:MAG TPA: helix-turn-helix domain-containing protein [Verrucomicrobiae bacterium]|nr:helix-turn-helix domain-containing protein [Verrucomicrobiae bacterium]
MKRTQFADQPCGVAKAMDIVGELWSFMIIRNVFLGVRRFEGLRENLGISRKVLTERLDLLVARGILERRQYHERPPRYEYRLTPMGVDLFPVLIALSRWGNRWLTDARGAPIEFVHRKCGEVTQARVVCNTCGEDLGAHNVRPQLGAGGELAYVEAIEQAGGGRPVFLKPGRVA